VNPFWSSVLIATTVTGTGLLLVFRLAFLPELDGEILYESTLEIDIPEIKRMRFGVTPVVHREIAGRSIIDQATEIVTDTALRPLAEQLDSQSHATGEFDATTTGNYKKTGKQARDTMFGGTMKKIAQVFERMRGGEDATEEIENDIQKQIDHPIEAPQPISQPSAGITDSKIVPAGSNVQPASAADNPSSHSLSDRDALLEAMRKTNGHVTPPTPSTLVHVEAPEVSKETQPARTLASGLSWIAQAGLDPNGSVDIKVRRRIMRVQAAMRGEASRALLARIAEEDVELAEEARALLASRAS
jgi:hypothetical protein